MQPQLFPSDRAKVAYHLTLIWMCSAMGTIHRGRQQSNNNTLTAFVSHFKEVFGQTTSELSVNDQLFQLRQGQFTVSDYALQFHTLAATSGWNEALLLTVLRQGLNHNIRQQMTIYDDVVRPENFLQKAIRISQHLIACNMDLPAASPPSATPSAPEPMQIDSCHLTCAERQWRIYNGLCFYCGTAGHQAIRD